MTAGNCIALAGVAAALLAVLISVRAHRNSTAPIILARDVWFVGTTPEYPDTRPRLHVPVDNHGLGPAFNVTVEALEHKEFESHTLAVIPVSAQRVEAELFLCGGTNLAGDSKVEFNIKTTYYDSYWRKYVTINNPSKNSLVEHRLPSLWEDIKCSFLPWPSTPVVMSKLSSAIERIKSFKNRVMNRLLRRG